MDERVDSVCKTVVVVVAECVRMCVERVVCGRDGEVWWL